MAFGLTCKYYFILTILADDGEAQKAKRNELTRDDAT
jgi:hypothetical protein